MGFNPLSRGLFVVLDRKKGRVLHVNEERKHALEVMGPCKGQFVMVELVSEGSRGLAARKKRIHPDEVTGLDAEFERAAGRQ